MSSCKTCMSDCMDQANATFIECTTSSPEVTTQQVTTATGSFTTPISFPSNRQLPLEENCKELSDEFSIQCQLSCPCNQNCPSCSQPTDSCKLDYCPVVSFKMKSTNDTTHIISYDSYVSWIYLQGNHNYNDYNCFSNDTRSINR